MAENDLINERIHKLDAFRKAGVEPYPASFSRTHRAAEVVLGMTALRVAGRIRGKRVNRQDAKDAEDAGGTAFQAVENHGQDARATGNTSVTAVLGALGVLAVSFRYPRADCSTCSAW